MHARPKQRVPAAIGAAIGESSGDDLASGNFHQFGASPLVSANDEPADDATTRPDYFSENDANKER